MFYLPLSGGGCHGPFVTMPQTGMILSSSKRQIQPSFPKPREQIGVDRWIQLENLKESSYRSHFVHIVSDRSKMSLSFVRSFVVCSSLFYGSNFDCPSFIRESRLACISLAKSLPNSFQQFSSRSRHRSTVSRTFRKNM